mgnify:CR=1 FL=1
MLQDILAEMASTAKALDGLRELEQMWQKEQELESKIINLRLQGMSEGQIAKQLKKEVEQLENLNVEKFWERIYFICRNINIQKLKK